MPMKISGFFFKGKNPPGFWDLEKSQASQLKVKRVSNNLRIKTNSDLLLVTETQTCAGLYVYTNTDTHQYTNFENNQKNSYSVSKYKVIRGLSQLF